MAQSPSFLQSMKADTAIHVYLALDWKNLVRQKKEKNYCDAHFSYKLPDQDSCMLKAKVRTRGHMRLDICEFPPLKLKISKEDLQAHQLAEWNEVDIVNHCFESEGYNQLILKEYLAYKLFELVSPYYFRTQLIKLHYINPDNSPSHDPSYAFLVEHPEELSSRLGARKINTKIITKNAIEKSPFLLVCLFQFMIGNTDWYIPTRHNLEFMAIPGHNLLVTIPFDFDYAGIVGASYAAHHASLKLPDVTMRYYQGWCHPEEEVKETLKIFLEQKENLLSMPYKIEGLNEKNRKECVNYLQGFFDIIENPRKLEKQVIEHCGMWPTWE